jgi:probable HAF family extracellular repeat protein
MNANNLCAITKLMLGLATALLSFPANAVPQFTATPIGPPGVPSSRGQAINASGDVAGQFKIIGESETHAFVNRSGTITDIGTLGAPYTVGLSINDRGDVTGFSIPAGSDEEHAFLYASGTLEDLNSRIGAASSGQAINANGAITGSASATPGGAERAFVYAGGAATDLGTLGGANSNGTAINAAGQVVGYAQISGSTVFHAFLYSGGTMQDLGTLGGRASGALGINASGSIVGYALVAGNVAEHAFRYAAGTMSDLGTLGGRNSAAYTINSTGEVVGKAQNAAGATRAFLYAEGAMQDLNALVVSGLNGTLTDAVGINDLGQIVANSCVGNVCQAYRLDRVAAAKVEAVEYWHAGFDHYFVTAIAAEITGLDNGTIAGWSRTGQTYFVYAETPIGASPVCRFFSAAFAPKSSHFYTPYPGECDAVKRNPDWQFEGLVFGVGVPAADGTCAAGTRAVYRLYNNGQGAAPNHRLVASATIRQQMLAQGWIPEGQGPEGVGMCAPL